MFRPVRLFSLGCVLALLAVALPSLGGGATQVARDSEAFAPGAQVAAANWSEMPNLTAASAPVGSDAVDNAVSCVNADFCMAVGAPANLTLPPFAEVWNGTAWAEVPLPAANGQTGDKVQLAGVFCVTMQFCLAVGNVVSSQTEAPLIEQWNGSSWSVTQSSGPDGTRLEDVSCVTVNFCMAAGATGLTTTSTYVEQWNGSTWAATTLPDPGTTTDAFALGISCTTPTFCMLDGGAGTSQSGGAYAASWDGTAWAPITVTNTINDVILQSVSCVGVGLCMADGTGGQNGNHATDTSNSLTFAV